MRISTATLKGGEMINERFQINRPDVIDEIFDDEVVIVNLKSGNYYSLEHVGAAVWSMIESGATRDEIVRSITERYAASYSEVENAIEHLLQEFQEEELVIAAQTSVSNGNFNLGVIKFGRGFEPPILHKYMDMQELLLLDPIHEVDETGWPRRFANFSEPSQQAEAASS